jgi:hypothetical protein
VTDPVIAQPLRETFVIHEPDPQVVVELQRTALSLEVGAQRVVYLVEPNTGGVSLEMFLALVERVAVLEAALLDAVYPSVSLFPSPTLYPKAG